MSRRVAEGMIAALMPAEAGGPDPVALAPVLERFLGHLSPQGRAGVRAAMAAVDGAALVTERRRLHRLDLDARERVLARILRIPNGDQLLDACKATVALVAGADSHADAMLAAALAAPPARPDADLDVTDSGSVASELRTDVVVVGSGAGGAMAARSLARAGADVLVVEEGRRFSVEEFRSDHPADRFGRLYRDGGATVAIGRPPVVLPIGRGVGGTTLVNSGTCYRTPDRVMADWRDHHGLARADPDRLSRYLDDVDALLSVAPVPLDIMGRNGRTMLDGAARLGWRSGPLRRNAPGCDGCCQCAIGCPRNAKYGVHLNALPDACAHGARIVSGLRVDRIETVPGIGADRAKGLHATREDGSVVVIRADAVVVAAGAVGTPPLLRRSGLGEHRRLGGNLALHPALSAAGRFDDDITPWHGVLQSAAIEEFHDAHGILIEATATPPGMGSMALPGHGRAFMDQVNDAHHLVTLGAMVADRGAGRVHGRSAGRTLLTYRLDRDDGRRLLTALFYMGRALFAAGAREVLTGVPDAAPVTDEDELEAVLRTADLRRMHLAAFHPTGTAAAGADPERHPVDPDGRVRGTDGVWVADASVLPTCPEVNPQVTIMAMAASIADDLAAARG